MLITSGEWIAGSWVFEYQGIRYLSAAASIFLLCYFFFLGLAISRNEGSDVKAAKLVYIMHRRVSSRGGFVCMFMDISLKTENDENCNSPGY